MKYMIKKLLFCVCFVVTATSLYCQGFNDNKTALSNFIKRMYNSNSFEGIKIIEDYDAKYLISVLSLEKAKYTSTSSMNRVAQVKAQSQASIFFNGSDITSEFIIKTSEEKVDSSDLKTTIETIEIIKENSVGFVKQLELLTNFEIEQGKRMLFIFIKQM